MRVFPERMDHAQRSRISGVHRARLGGSPARGPDPGGRGGAVEQLELEQRPHVLHGWVAQLRERFGGRPVGIAIEQRRGAVVHALMQYDFLVLYPVNPKTLARYREAFHPSGAKD